MAWVSTRTEEGLAKMLAAKGGDLVIGLGGEAATEGGEALPGSLRVAVTRNDIIVMMSPKEARALADRFDAHPEQCREAGVEWIPQTLREVADEIDDKIKQHN